MGKELIIGAGGENIAPVPIEDWIKSNFTAISNIMMVGDKRKYNTALITLKAKSFQDYMTKALTAANNNSDVCASNVSKIQYFRILPRDFSTETGEFTPTFKLKRGPAAEIWNDL